MKDNPVAKNAHKFNKRAAGPHKDKKRAMKKGDRKHKGRYEENGNVDEVFTTTAISNFFKKSGEKKKYDKVVKQIKKGKYSVAKAAQMFDLDGRILQNMVTEWSCNTTEKTRRVKGGDKRKGYMKEKQVEEEKKGLWDRIHAKRKRGEKPAKPGDKDYPKTLDVGEGLKQARKNVGSDSCWDGYKAKGTKMKGGKEVPDCKKEGFFGKKDDKKDKKKENPRRKSDAVNSLLNRPKQMRGRKEQIESAQDRLDRMAKKHGLGKPNKAADDYISKMMKKYGAKDMADLKKKMGMKEENIDELSVKTLNNYRRKASKPNPNDSVAKQDKRYSGVARASRKLDKKLEDVNELKTSTLQSYSKKADLSRMGSTGNDHSNTKKRVKGLSRAKSSLDKRGVKQKQYGEDVNELTQRELDMMAKRKKSNLVKRGKAKPEPKQPKQKDKSAGRVTAKQSDDDHLVMQLRKAQDVKGNMDIKVTPTGKTVKLPIKMIDKLLATHDKLQKPDEKRKFRILVTKELRKRAK